jgi:hypothetical protein
MYQPEVPQNALNTPSRCIWLPPLHEAQVLLQKYLRDVDHIHHTTHAPSLPGMVDEAYRSLQQSGQIKSGPAILLLAIFASATHSWFPVDCELGLFATATEANDQSVLWAKAALDVIDGVYRAPCAVTLEGCQGIMILAFVIGSTEGFSRRCRGLFTIALFIARELRLHRIDHPSNAANANTIQAEMGRRIWWYIASTDWQVLLSCS